MSHAVFGNINLLRHICTFLPLEDLPNVCKTNCALRALTRTREAADLALRALLRTATKANVDVYKRFHAARVNPDMPQGELALIRQMPALRDLRVTTSIGRFFLEGLELIHNKQAPKACDPYLLESLDLTYQRVVHGDSVNLVVFDALANYQKLQKLRLDCAALNDSTIETLIKIPSLTDVALVNFAIDSWFHIGRTGIRGLLTHLPQLRSLTLGYGVPDPSKHFSPDPRAGAAAVLTYHGKNLVTLRLHGNQDNPGEILAMINACPKLTLLDVTGSHFATRWTERDARGYSQIWYEVLAELAKARPNLQIKGPPKD